MLPCKKRNVKNARPGGLDLVITVEKWGLCCSSWTLVARIASCCDIIVRTEAGICDGIGDLPSNPLTRILDPRVTPRTLGTWAAETCRL